MTDYEDMEEMIFVFFSYTRKNIWEDWAWEIYMDEILDRKKLFEHKWKIEEIFLDTWSYELKEFLHNNYIYTKNKKYTNLEE
jgi:hypothetical protein